MAGGSSTGTSAQQPNTLNPVTGYAPRQTVDPFSGYAPPPVQQDPFRSSLRAKFDIGLQRREREAYNQQRINLEKAQQQDILARQQQVQRDIGYLSPGYRSARQMPQRSPFGGGFNQPMFNPFGYAPPDTGYFHPAPQPAMGFRNAVMPQPAGFTPTPIGPPRSQTQTFEMMPGSGLAGLFSGFYR